MTYNEKQIQIMEAAEQLFAEKGFDGTSVRDIADKAAVNLAMISYYFGSKEKLLEALFTYRGEHTVMKLESIISDKDMEPLQKMDILIDYYIDKFMNQQCFHKIMTREQVTNQRGVTSDLILNLKKETHPAVQLQYFF